MNKFNKFLKLDCRTYFPVSKAAYSPDTTAWPSAFRWIRSKFNLAASGQQIRMKIRREKQWPRERSRPRVFDSSKNTAARLIETGKFRRRPRGARRVKGSRAIRVALKTSTPRLGVCSRRWLSLIKGSGKDAETQHRPWGHVRETSAERPL